MKTQKQSQKTETAVKCPNCGMARTDWPDSEGFSEDGKTYCCEGCAHGTGCTCVEDADFEE